KLPDGFGPLQLLFSGMASPLPDGRPSLDAVASELDGHLEQLAPERAFAEALARDRVRANALLRDAESTFRAGAYRLTKRTFHLLQADWLLAEAKPDCRKALTYLSALTPEEVARDHEVRLRRGRAYALWKDHPDHLQESESEFRAAVVWSGYDHAVQ